MNNSAQQIAPIRLSKKSVWITLKAYLEANVENWKIEIAIKRLEWENTYTRMYLSKEKPPMKLSEYIKYKEHRLLKRLNNGESWKYKYHRKPSLTINN